MMLTEVGNKLRSIFKILFSAKKRLQANDLLLPNHFPNNKTNDQSS